MAPLISRNGRGRAASREQRSCDCRRGARREYYIVRQQTLAESGLPHIRCLQRCLVTSTLMPLQSPPSLSSQDDSSPSSSSQASSSGLNTSPASSRPLLRTSTSDPAAGLTIPFEQLTLQEQKDFWSHHPQIAHVKAHAPRNPSVGIEPQQIEPREYYNMEMFDNRMREHEGGKGKGKDAGTQLQHRKHRPVHL